MKISHTADLWWKTGVFYCADVQTYLDWDGDGIGDLEGMTNRIDYLADLGVTCLWLMPFYPTGGRDDGYDITDFYGVDPRVGSHGQFVELIATAKSRGLRVVIDFVMNHTSDQHPWFQDALTGPDAAKRDWYVWRRSTPPDTSDEVVFPDAEDSIWERDEASGQFFLHHFLRTQPDLNVANPEVREEILRTIGFWLQLGVDGFRVDAVPFLFQDDDLPEEDRRFPPISPHDWLRELKAFASRRAGDVLLLGEVNLPHDQQQTFFGGAAGDELNLQFDFIGMQKFYLAFARRDASPLVEALNQRPGPNVKSQWATFLRNHDELTLDRLSPAERQEVFDAFGPEKSMQLYGRGLRRRLPPMLDGDLPRLKLAYSIMFSTPGTPVLFYGEEIGMGENLDVPGRLAVRTPMQWADAEVGGFTTAPANRLERPLPTGPYGPAQVNAAAARQDPDSLLRFVQRLIGAYRQAPELGWADFLEVPQSHDQILAHVAISGDWATLPVHNLGSEALRTTLKLPDTLDLPEGTRFVDVLDEQTFEPEQRTLTVDLSGYGTRWLRRVIPGDRRIG